MRRARRPDQTNSGFDPTVVTARRFLLKVQPPEPLPRLGSTGGLFDGHVALARAACGRGWAAAAVPGARGRASAGSGAARMEAIRSSMRTGSSWRMLDANKLCSSATAASGSGPVCSSACTGTAWRPRTPRAGSTGGSWPWTGATLRRRCRAQMAERRGATGASGVEVDGHHPPACSPPPVPFDDTNFPRRRRRHARLRPPSPAGTPEGRPKRARRRMVGPRRMRRKPVGG